MLLWPIEPGFILSHTAATSPVGSPGSAAVTVEGAPSESSTEVVGTPAEEQMSRYTEWGKFISSENQTSSVVIVSFD